MFFDLRNYQDNLRGFLEYTTDVATSCSSFGDEQLEWEDSLLIGIPLWTYRLLTRQPKHLTGLLFGNIVATMCLALIALIICPLLLLANVLIRGLLILIPLPFVLFFSVTNNFKRYGVQ